MYPVGSSSLWPPIAAAALIWEYRALSHRRARKFRGVDIPEALLLVLGKQGIEYRLTCLRYRGDSWRQVPVIAFCQTIALSASASAARSAARAMYGPRVPTCTRTGSNLWSYSDILCCPCCTLSLYTSEGLCGEGTDHGKLGRQAIMQCKSI